ncbi:MAG TPA: TonB family protein [Gammaproteobacteria bacterium]|jgi:TonB family protein
MKTAPGDLAMRNLILPAALALLFPGVSLGDDTPKPDAMHTYFEEMKAQAVKGNVQAEECLAELYSYGQGTPADASQARTLFSEAAAAGDLRAQERLAQWDAWSEGSDQDIPKAIAAFQQLIDKGYLPAASDLALLYIDGTGVPKDEAKALGLLRRAAGAGDPEAEMRLGLFYHVGDHGLPKDQNLSKRWLEKAVGHTFYCVTTFGNFTNFVIDGYLPPIDSKHDWGPMAPLNIMYTYHDGHAVGAYVRMSSGIPEFDQGWLEATGAAKLPPWPSSYQADDKTLGFFIQGNEGDMDLDFAKALHDAIKAATVMPLTVLVNGSNGSGSVNLGLDYRDGKVSNAKVVTSSGEPAEDEAALKAVETAAYPPTPKKYAHKTFHMGFRIEFGRINPSTSASTAVAPASASSPSPGEG